MKLDDRLCEYLNAMANDFVPAEEAEIFLADMQENHPGELDEWMLAKAQVFVTYTMSAKLRSARARASHQARSKSFGELSGAEESIDQFKVVYMIDSLHTRRRLADMTGGDHRFVADNYEASGNRNLLLAAFHRSVAKKIGRKRTADVLTAEQYEAMLRSFTSPDRDESAA